MPIVTTKQFNELLDKYLAGNATEEETELLHRVYDELAQRSQIADEDMPAAGMMEKDFLRKLHAAVDEEKEHSKKEVRLWPLSAKYMRAIAASILILITTLGWLYVSRSNDDAQYPMTGQLVTYQNLHNETEKIEFEDHSYVELAKGSTIVYNQHFAANKRMVYLKGRGFFQITKDHSRPFIVYTDRVVTKVLGTSFLVDNIAKDAPASVTVVTGRVAVFKKEDFKPENANADLNGGVLITPNQSVSLIRKEPLQKSLASKPAVIPGHQQVDFNFDNTPLDTVFARLEQAYGIPIRFTAGQYQNCTLSVSMGNEGFYQKLDLISKTLNLSYHIKESTVVIEGNGCSE